MFSAASQDVRATFNEAKSLFDQERYALALGRFKQISELEQDNDLVRYASFYYAVSAYRSGDALEARNKFVDIGQTYKDWQVQDEINFWLAKIAFEEGAYGDGLSYLKKITADSLKADVELLERAHLKQISDTVQLKSLLEKYGDSFVAKRLLTELVKVPVSSQNLDLIKDLSQTYDVYSETDLGEIVSSPKKEVYNVGVFFPFQYQGDSASLVRVMNDWPIKFLEGIELGLNKLKEEGIEINLLTFDTRMSASVTRSILAEESMKELDLIIGPIYSGPTNEVVRFAKENKVNMINPLSSNGEILIDNPFAFLYYPSNESLAIAAADHARKNFRHNKNTAIFYATDADRMRAELYRKLIEKDSFNVVIYEMVRPNESVKIQQMLVEEVEVDRDSSEVERMISEMDSLLEAGVENWKIYDERDFVYDTLGILPDSLGHIFIASDVPSLSASAISGIEARPDSIGYLGSSRWLHSEQSLSFEQLERVNAVFTGSNWIDYDKANVQEFRERFLERFYAFPRKEERLADAYSGYDIIVTYGRLLHKYGKYFQLSINSIPTIEGELADGFDYRLTNDNRYIPILRMVDSKLQISNK